MPDKVPLREQITEVRRELAMRQQVYPRFVSLGRMHHVDATRYTMRLEAVLATLLELEKGERLL